MTKYSGIIKGITIACLAGVSLISATAAQAEEVTIWSWDPNFNGAVMEEASRRYKKNHPDVTFNLVDFSKKDVETKLQVALTSGVKNTLPDIVLIEDYSAQKYLQSFPGSFAALSGKVDFSGFAPYKVELMTDDKKVYGMPFDSGVTGLFYREDYLAEAGFSASDMQNLTWDRYIEIGKVVKAKTGKNMIGFDINDSDLTRIMTQSAGEWFFDSDGKINILENKGLRAALDVQQKLLAADISRPSVGWTDWVGSFNSGEVATVISGVWITGSIKSQADQAGKWRVAPIPKLDIEGAENASNLGGSSWYVINSSKEKDVSIDFLNEIFAKDVDFYQSILQQQGAIGSLLKSREGKAYNESDSYFGGEQVWQNFSDWIAKVPPVNYGVYSNEAVSAVTSNMGIIKDNKPVEEALVAIDMQLKNQIQ